MRRRRTLIVLLLALASGGLAGYSALQLMEQRDVRVPIQDDEPATQIVVAARDIGAGEKLAEEDVKLIEWPGDIVPEGFAREKSQVLGRGVITPVSLNEPLLESKLADRSGGFGLPIMIDEGKRAIAIRVNEIKNVAGWWQPGTRADLILWTEPPGGGPPTARTVKQNLELLAMNAMTEMNAEGQPVNYTLATLHVTPEDAEDIVMLQEQGDITMVLRNTLDLAEIRTPGATIARVWRELPGTQVAARPARRPVAEPTPVENNTGFITIIRGTTTTTVKPGGGG